MLLRHCFAFLLLSFPVLLQAQPARFTDTARLQKIRAALPAVEKIYRDHFEAQGFPGLAFGVVVDGQLLQSGGFGFADLEQRVPAGPASVFRIASMTKSFTALAILQLRDAGRLQLDEPAARYLPELAGLSYLTTDAAPLTVRQLLAHAAGFPEDNPWGDRQLADSEAELRKLLQDSVRFSTTPGTAYEYSNLGFALLGNIISRVSGQPYQQYIAERVLRPLGMRSTYWDFKKVPAAALAKGYRKVNGQWVAEPLLADGVWGAMGGLLTSVEDFGNYMALHLSAWPARSGEEHPVLRRSSLREMHHPWNFAGLSADYTYPDGRKTAMASAYGYGLRWTRDGNELVSVGHSGGLPGYGCQWKMYPDYGIAVVCLANGTYAPTGVANQRALDTLVALAGLQPRALPSSSILLQRQRQLAALLPHWRGAESSGLFAENFFLDRSIDSWRRQSAEALGKIGRIIKVGELAPENNLRGRFVLQGERGSVEVFFTLTPEREPKVQELRLR